MNITIRYTVNYLFFWAIYNWKMSLTMLWFDQYLAEQTCEKAHYSSIIEYLIYETPKSELLYPALTSIAAMVILPLIDKYLQKLNIIINKTLKL